MRMILLLESITIVILIGIIVALVISNRGKQRRINESEDPMLLLPREERVQRVREQLEREQEAYEQELLERNMDIIRRHGGEKELS